MLLGLEVSLLCSIRLDCIQVSCLALALHSVFCIVYLGNRASLLVRAPDSRSRGCKFESLRENFLLQSQLCVLTLLLCPFHPRVTAVARKRPKSLCQKCRWQVTPKHSYTLDPTKSEWAVCRYPGIVCEPPWKRAHTQLVREHSATVVSGR